MNQSTVTMSLVQIENPDSKNVIVGQSHFIKTVEDIHELMVNAVPGIQFGLAFSEASGPRMIRKSGTNDTMINLAVQNAKAIAAGHTFVLFLDNAFPINVLTQLKMLPEIATIFCATANPTQIIIAQSEQGRGIMGVIDGGSPMGVEDESGTSERKSFLRKIGYKL